MGQYWKVVNLDKKEVLHAHKLGVGLKLGEQIGSGHGTPDALFILVAAMRERRGTMMRNLTSFDRVARSRVSASSAGRRLAAAK